MKPSLYATNTPQAFWQLVQVPGVLPSQWRVAQTTAAESLLPALLNTPSTADLRLGQILGEGQFGAEHWQLGPASRLYYHLKPLLPRWFTRLLRRAYSQPATAKFRLGWPVEERYAHFQWECMRQMLILADIASIPFIHFWPEGHRFAFVLTHDIETAEGQAYVRAVADLEESLGFRSSFNFVPERYPVDHGLMQELRQRGFEIGVHGLKHDGKLFSSRAEFDRRVGRINRYLKEWNATGFRAPLTHRQPEWMQALEIEYDLSFFDSDPYEPIPGGTMSIWPFELGHFVELPYTLVQDHTLTTVLKHKTPRLWLQKVKFIQDYCGMVLVNTHPDYLRAADTWMVYVEFLQEMKKIRDFWPSFRAMWPVGGDSGAGGIHRFPARRGSESGGVSGEDLVIEPLSDDR